MNENSPAFQRRELNAEFVSPEGTAEVGELRLVQSSLRDSALYAADPGVKTPGYSHNVPSGRTLPPTLVPLLILLCYSSTGLYFGILTRF